jgi:hypothetical protein
MEVESTSAAVPEQGGSSRRPIGEFLVERGLVTPEQLAAALADQRQSGKRLGEILVERGAITRMALASVLGEQWEEAGRHLRSVVPVRLAGGKEADAGIAGGEELTESLASLQAAVARLEDLSSVGPKHAETAPATGSDDGLAGIEAALAAVRAELAELRTTVAAPLVVEGDLAERLGELDSWLRERDDDSGAQLAQAVEALGARVESLARTPDLGSLEHRLDELAALVARPAVDTAPVVEAPTVDLTPISARLDELVDLATRPADPEPGVGERLDRIDAWLREHDGDGLGASLDAAVERLGERLGAPVDDEVRERLARVETLLTERADTLSPELARRLDEVEAAAKRPRDGGVVARFERLEELLDRQPALDTKDLHERLDALQPVSEAAFERLARVEELLREPREPETVSAEQIAAVVGSALDERLGTRDLTWEAAVERLGRLEDSLREALGSRADDALDELKAAVDELRTRLEPPASPERVVELVGSVVEERLGRLEQSVAAALVRPEREDTSAAVGELVGSKLEEHAARLEERLGGRDLAWEAAVERLGRLEDSLQQALAPREHDGLDEIRARLEELRAAAATPRDEPERTAELLRAELAETEGR